MFEIAVNFDEISDDLGSALRVMRDCNTWYGELRTISRKNFVFWSDEEVERFREKVQAARVRVVAAASPLFKWYVDDYDEPVEHDNFGFNPHLDDGEKKQTINRAMEVASRLAIPRLRIFSGLGRADAPGLRFAHDPLLRLALDLADRYGIDLCVENEPVCRVHTQSHILQLLESQQCPRLRLWFDIANSVEVGEDVNEAFIRRVADRLAYVHVKDFVIEDGRMRYVPLGEGQIDYPTILSTVKTALGGRDMVLSVETHATQNKADASRQSLLSLRKMIGDLGSQA